MIEKDVKKIAHDVERLFRKSINKKTIPLYDSGRIIEFTIPTSGRIVQEFQESKNEISARIIERIRLKIKWNGDIFALCYSDPLFEPRITIKFIIPN